MMTVAKGRAHTRKLVLVYTVLLAPVALALSFTQIGGAVYFTTALVLNLAFLAGALAIWRQPEATAEATKYRLEKRVFGFSIAYLFIHFVALLVEAGLDVLGWSISFPVWF